MFVKRKWSFFNSPFLSIFAIFEIGGVCSLRGCQIVHDSHKKQYLPPLDRELDELQFDVYILFQQEI